MTDFRPGVLVLNKTLIIRNLNIIILTKCSLLLFKLYLCYRWKTSIIIKADRTSDNCVIFLKMQVHVHVCLVWEYNPNTTISVLIVIHSAVIVITTNVVREIPRYVKKSFLEHIRICISSQIVRFIYSQTNDTLIVYWVHRNQN